MRGPYTAEQTKVGLADHWRILDGDGNLIAWGSDGAITRIMACLNALDGYNPVAELEAQNERLTNNLANAEQEVADLKAKIPGPFDVVVTVPLPVNGKCDRDCQLGYACGWKQQDSRAWGEWYPGPGCPRYHIPDATKKVEEDKP